MIKYFISFAFTDENGMPRFGNCFYKCNKNIEEIDQLNTVTKDISTANNIKDVVVMNYQKV